MDGGGDIVGELQKQFIAMSTTMYNAIGILQRDAVPVSLDVNTTADTTLNGMLQSLYLIELPFFLEIRKKLVDEILIQSKTIDTLLGRLPQVLPDHEAVMNDIQSLTSSLPMAITNQEERVKISQKRLESLEASFNDLIAERLTKVVSTSQ